MPPPTRTCKADARGASVHEHKVASFDRAYKMQQLVRSQPRLHVHTYTHKHIHIHTNTYTYTRDTKYRVT